MCGLMTSLLDVLAVIDILPWSCDQKIVRSTLLASAFRLGLTEAPKIAGNKFKEAGLLFFLGSILVYREVKANMNLDSEKMPATTKKVEQIIAALQKEFPNHTINGSILCPTRLESSDDIEGLNDYLVLLGYDRITVKEFDKIGEMMGKKVREALAN
jgi:hypothetical protein